VNSLYEIDWRWRSINETIASILAECEAEAPDDIAFLVDDIVQKLQSDSEEAIHGGVNYLRSMESLARAKRDEARTLTEQARALEDRAQIAKQAIRKVVDQRFAGHIVTGPYDVRTRTVPPPLVLDEIEPEALPERFRKVSYSADKAAIKASLQNGEPLSFASFGEASRTLTIK